MTRFSAEEKAQWVEDFKKSGLSAGAYAKANGLNEQTLRNWDKGRRADPGAGFVEIRPKLLAPKGPGNEIIIEKGSMKIRLPMSMDAEGLTQLLCVLWRLA
jgi:transposase-like protein